MFVLLLLLLVCCLCWFLFVVCCVSVVRCLVGVFNFPVVVVVVVLFILCVYCLELLCQLFIADQRLQILRRPWRSFLSSILWLRRGARLRIVSKSALRAIFAVAACKLPTGCGGAGPVLRLQSLLILLPTLLRHVGK